MNLIVPHVTIDYLLAPLADTPPCGPSLRYDNDYDRLRELRREDDASLPTGVWQSEIKRSDWPAVEKLASELLGGRSKDLMIAAWLGEAWVHRHGIDGLSQALKLLAGLCERYPDELHPLAEDGDPSWRVTPLDWLARQYAEVLHTRVPLFGEGAGDFATFSLFDWQQLQHQQVLGGDNKAAKAAAEAARLQQQKLNERLREIPAATWQHRHSQLLASVDDLQRLDAWSDMHLHDQAPSYQPLRDVMAAMTALLEEFLAMHPAPPVAAPAPVIEERQPAASAQSAAAVPVGGLNSREDAYRQLVQIADYLARTEPHSPVPYLIKRAVEWGHKPLNELLNELLSADAESRRVWALLGVLK